VSAVDRSSGSTHSPLESIVGIMKVLVLSMKG